MTAPRLSGIDYKGHKINNAVLGGVKFAERTGSEVSGQFFMKNDVLHFKNLTNVEVPIHDNSIKNISSVGPVVTTTNGRTVEISIETASGTTNGIISVADYLLLVGSTHLNTPSSIVRRDASGNFSAGIITAAELSGLSASPTGASSAASKSYVDNQVQQLAASVIGGLDSKDSVRVAMNVNVPLASVAGTYDGIPLVVGDDLLLVGQTNSVENGAYVVTAGGFVRRSDSNSANNLTPGATYQVESGSYAQEVFTLVVARNYTLGTSPLTFLNIPGLNALIGGDGCEKIGKVLHVRGTTNRVAVTADAVDIAATYAGQASINTVGTITNGTWEGTVISVEKGGTGSNSLPTARQILGISETLEFTLGDGVATTFPISHNLNNPRVEVLGWYNNKYMGSQVDYDFVDLNTITINASLNNGATPIAANSLIVKVIGKKL